MLNTKHVLMLKQFIVQSQYDSQSYHSLVTSLDIDNGKEIFKNVYKIYHAYERLTTYNYRTMFRDMEDMIDFDFGNVALLEVAEHYDTFEGYYIDDILDVIINKKYFPEEEDPRDPLLNLKTIRDNLPELEKSVDHSDWQDWYVVLDDDFKEAIDELIDGIIALEKELPE